MKSAYFTPTFRVWGKMARFGGIDKIEKISYSLPSPFLVKEVEKVVRRHLQRVFAEENE